MIDVAFCEFGVISDDKGNFICATAPGDTRFCDKLDKTIPKAEWTKEKCGGGKFKINYPIVFGALAGLLTLAISSIRFFRDRNPGVLIVGLVAGGIVGVVVYLIMSKIVEILIGVTILGIAGGVLLYLFGGVFVVISMVIGMIINNFKGRRK